MSGSHTMQGFKMKELQERCIQKCCSRHFSHVHRGQLDIAFESSLPYASWFSFEAEVGAPSEHGGCGGGSSHAGRTAEYFQPPCVGWKASGFIGISTHTSAWDGQQVLSSLGPPASVCHHMEQEK